jgi:vacuolar-type H+-ATPase subunit D/Vma8
MSVKNICNIENDIDDNVDNLVPIKYFNKTLNKTDYGFELESVIESLPDLITKIDSTSNGIDYTSLIPILVKEIQMIKQKLQPKIRKDLDIIIDNIPQIKPVFRTK